MKVGDLVKCSWFDVEFVGVVIGFDKYDNPCINSGIDLEWVLHRSKVEVICGS